jgi:hypothetical protein
MLDSGLAEHSSPALVSLKLSSLMFGEWTWNSLCNTFADNDLQFGLHIWEKDQYHACAGGAADVNGPTKSPNKCATTPNPRIWCKLEDGH